MSQPRYGHWCTLFKRGNILEFFNPYGGYPDNTLNFITKKFRDSSNQNYTYLSKLLLECPYELEYNEHKFQKMNINTKTCGRHCAIRLYFRELSLENYYDLLVILSQMFHKNFDEIVTLMTLFVNKK